MRKSRTAKFPKSKMNKALFIGSILLFIYKFPKEIYEPLEYWFKIYLFIKDLILQLIS